MSTVDRLNKFREERALKEKARIEKLRELNLKKYGKLGNPSTNPKSNTSQVNQTLKPIKNNTANVEKYKLTQKLKQNEVNNIKQVSKESSTQGAVQTEKKVIQKIVPYKGVINIGSTQSTVVEKTSKAGPSKLPKISDACKSVTGVKSVKKPEVARKSMLPTVKCEESVFDRLYKPKPVPKKGLDDVQKLKSDPNYLKKVMKDAGMIVNKRHTVMEAKVTAARRPVRRSISAVHFKRISKSEIDNCIHKWASIGDKMDKVDLQNISEDNEVKEDKMVIAVRSERKKVKFQTPCHNYNTPRPQELQARLKSWLQRRGKALDSYQHLQCFGINHLQVKTLNLEDMATGDEKMDQELEKDFNGDDENKENIALDSDSDDGSYSENLNISNGKDSPLKPATQLPSGGWRCASMISESADLNDTVNTTLTSGDVATVDEILLGALNDLTDLLKEGFEWEQCARWLRAIRERFSHAPNTAAYWECRAQLEERRGDLPASVQCWEEAIVKGTQHSVVEASLDQLLDKFMQLKISPNSGRGRQVDPKMVDVKNVFKSTIIRFAVQQAKIRQSEGPKFTVTPVRRSARLSAHWSGKRTPLQVCTSVRQAGESLGQKLLFVPNETLSGTP